MDPAASPGVRAAVFYYGNGDAPAFRTDLPVFHVLAGLDGGKPHAALGETRRIFEEIADGLLQILLLHGDGEMRR